MASQWPPTFKNSNTLDQMAQQGHGQSTGWFCKSIEKNYVWYDSFGCHTHF